jgi:hypothetical protein
MRLRIRIFNLMQRTEVDLEQHRHDHDPNQQAYLNIDLRDFLPANELEQCRKPLSQHNACNDA